MASATHTERPDAGRSSSVRPSVSADASAAVVDALVRECLVWAAEQPPSSGLRLLAGWQAGLDLTEAQLIARSAGLSTPAGRDRLAEEQNISKSEARKKTERAEAIRQNPELGDKLADGQITAEHVDVLADAERKTPGAWNDPTLVADVCGVRPDQAKKKADRYRSEQMKAAEAEARYRRQRDLRGVRKHTTPEGMPAITMQGDQAAINEVWQQILRSADAMYRLDGGRDLANDRHERSHRQRLFDAAFGLVAGEASDSGERGGSSRPTVVIDISASKFEGTDPSAVAQIVGVGPIPDPVLARYLCNSDLVAMVLGASGENLWQGRRVRYATRAQLLALIQRDRGCVLCGAPHAMCEAHHLLPWNASGQGETNLENLALVCSSCHHFIHDNDLTLFREPATDRWKTRPATVHERAPRRSGTKRKRAA